MKYTDGYTDGFSDGFADNPLPTREVKHLVYMIATFTTVMAALAYPRITTLVAGAGLLLGVGWWFYPLARAKFTKPVQKVEEPVRTANPRVHDQRAAVSPTDATQQLPKVEA